MRRTAHASHLTAPTSGRGDLKPNYDKPDNPRTFASEEQVAAEADPKEWWRLYVTHYGSEKPSKFAEVLTNTIPIEVGRTKLLDIGCGCGVIGIASLMKKARSVTFNDVVSNWIETTRSNVALKVRAAVIDESQVAFLTPASFTEMSDDIIAQHTLLSFNPPQLPQDYVRGETLHKIEADPTQAHFRLGGNDGLKMPRLFLDWYAHRTIAMPDAVITLSGFLGQTRIQQMIDTYGLREVSRARTRIGLRTIFDEEKIQELSEADMKDRTLEPDGQGWWTKELFTITLRKA